MNKHNAVKAAPPVSPHTPEQYAGFEVSVLAAAQEQANRIVEQAKQESDAAYNAALSRLKGDPVAARRTQNEAALRRRIAAAQQENLRKLLVYRKQLVNGLFAEAEEELEAFTSTPDYAGFLGQVLAPYAEKAAENCIVLLRPQDMAHQTALAGLLPHAVFQADVTIRLGGAKLICGRVVYDETLDERLRAQRTAFLTRCNLHVQPKQEDEA